MYRYVCPNCLRTFTDSTFDADRFCFECGQRLVIVPGMENGKEDE